MSHPCQYNVYLRAKGEAKKIMLASFADRTDAVNFAAEKSKGQYNAPNLRVDALNYDRKIFMSFREGERIK